MKFSSKIRHIRQSGLRNAWRLIRRQKNKHVVVDKSVVEYIDRLTLETFDDNFMRLWETTESLVQSNMQIDLTEASFLRLLTKMTNAKSILEVGTFRGWSTAVFASVCNKVITLEKDPKQAAMAKNMWLKHLSPDIFARIDVRVGDAKKTLTEIPAKKSFDLIFIDADKAGYPMYLEQCKPLVRKGGLIILDNMLNAGLVAREAKETDKVTRAIQNTIGKAFSKTTMEEFEPVIIPAWDGVVILLAK